MPKYNTRVWYVTDARTNVNFTTGFTVLSGDSNRYTVNGNVTRLTADVWNTGSGDQIGNVRSQEWASTGDVINAQVLKVAKDEASSSTPPAPVSKDPVVKNGSWNVRSVTANYTLTKNDYPFVLIKSTGSSAITVTIPADADLAFPLETPVRWRQTGTGQVTFAPASGVTLNSLAGNRKSSAQYAQGELVRTSANTWALSGNISA